MFTLKQNIILVTNTTRNSGTDTPVKNVTKKSK